jgi:predicted SnoaL-like aldol condensation-catalyzing enzyme
MKKLLFIPLALLGIFCISCNNDSGGLSATAKKNLDAMHGIQKAFDTKDFSKVGDYIAEDGIDHAGQEGDVKGVANIKAAFEKMAAMSENDKTEIIKELADDEYVMSWSHYTGTAKVAGMGFKPGDKIDMNAIELTKFKDGKAVEHWSFMQPNDMMKMMATPPPPAMHGDSL